MKPIPFARPRGFTLVELLIASGMASLVVAAAVTVFLATGTKQRHSERVLEATNASTLAASVMEFDLSSAGYRWPSSTYGVKHFNNVSSADSVPSDGSPITTTANCAGTGVGVVAGTDIIEVATGFESMSPGTVGSLSGANVVLKNVAPFTSLETTGSGVGSVLLFVADTGASIGMSCMGKVTSISGVSTDGGSDSPTTLGLTALDRNFQTGGAVTGCPAIGMRAYRLGTRTRYMVCGTPTDPGTMSLYRQIAGTNGVWAPPAMVQEGIEDLQIAPRYLNNVGTPIASTGTGANCVTMGTGGSSMCTCNDAVPPTCNVPASEQQPTPLITIVGAANISKVALMRGVAVEVSAVSHRKRGQTADARRPESFDHPQALPTEVDDYDRRRNRFAVTFDNMGLRP